MSTWGKKRLGSTSVRNISRIHSCLHIFVSSKLDYCNALVVWTSDRRTQQLLHIQISCVRVLTRRRKYDHNPTILHFLHWLPIQQRIQCISLLTFHCVHGHAPDHLTELLTYPHPHHGSTAPGLRICLPDYPRAPLTVESLRSILKHFHFKSSLVFYTPLLSHLFCFNILLSANYFYQYYCLSKIFSPMLKWQHFYPACVNDCNYSLKKQNKKKSLIH